MHVHELQEVSMYAHVHVTMRLACKSMKCFDEVSIVFPEASLCNGFGNFKFCHL